MKTILTTLLLLILHGSTHQLFAQRTIADPNAQLRTTGSFSGIVVGGSFNVYISQAPTTTVAVSASKPSSVEFITTEVRDGVLYVGFNTKGMEWGGKDLRVYIALPTLNKIKVSGACDVFIDDQLRADDLFVELSGSSDFRGNLRITNLRLEAHGSSDFQLRGKATTAKITLSGSSDVKAFELETDFCEINTSGASDVNITVQKEMKVKASGSSDVKYRGAGSLREVSSSGASTVKKIN
ncbi:MAG: DUF2807 domain-containing protein [Bacteroidetes bacterium]|nr:MAG: DUF2807 domain-containing protein [Bacteroidota bacterium]